MKFDDVKACSKEQLREFNKEVHGLIKYNEVKMKHSHENQGYEDNQFGYYLCALGYIVCVIIISAWFFNLFLG